MNVDELHALCVDNMIELEKFPIAAVPEECYIMTGLYTVDHNSLDSK
jgi:hypothetical protein